MTIEHHEKRTISDTLRVSWKTVKNNLELVRPLYLVGGAIIVLVALQTLAIVLGQFNADSPSAISLILVVSIAFLGGFLTGILLLAWKALRASPPEEEATAPIDEVSTAPQSEEAPAAPQRSATVVQMPPSRAIAADAGVTAPSLSEAPAAGESSFREIPVEGLANGIINMLGDGLGAVIDTGLSVGSSVKSEVSNTVKTVACEANARIDMVKSGVGKAYTFAYRQAGGDKDVPKKKDKEAPKKAA